MTPRPPVAVFRCDASPSIGAGHVMRCLTLADALVRRQLAVGFACVAGSLGLVPALAEGGHRIMTVGGDVSCEPEELLRGWPAGVEFLIVDHYSRGADFERACRGWAKRIVAFDDEPWRSHAVDLLIDQTVGRSENEYCGVVGDGTRLLTGSDFIMLRADVRRNGRGNRAVPAQATQLLVTFGSADSTNLSGRAADALRDERLRTVSASIVIGPGYAWADQLRQSVPSNASVLVNPGDFVGLMSRSDIALTASGTTCWELAHLGVPMLIVTAGRGTVGPALQDAGAARWLGHEDRITPTVIADALVELRGDAEARKAMGAAGRKLVDGHGAERAALEIEEMRH